MPDAGLITRRDAMRAGGMGLVAATFPLAAAAQDATPAVDTEALPPALVTWLDGWQAMDLDAIAGAFAEDGTHVDVPLGMITAGREAIRERFAMTSDAFPDNTIEVRNVFASASGDRAAIEWVFAGTYLGQAPGFPPGEGQAISFLGASMIDLRDGEIAEERWYYDVFGLMVQIGMLPPPDMPTEATPAT